MSMTSGRGAMLAGVAVCALACVHAKTQHPLFDARCDCEGEPSAREATAGTSNQAWPEPGANASLVDYAIARLTPTPASPNPAVASFLTHPGDFDDAVADALDSDRARAENAADATADEVGRTVTNELSSLRQALEDAHAAGDEAQAIEARSRLWARYDEALAQMSDAATATARAALPPPEKAIVLACDEVASDTLGDVTLMLQTKVGMVRNQLEPVLVARYEEAREVVVKAIVDAVIARHRPRLVIAMST